MKIVLVVLISILSFSCASGPDKETKSPDTAVARTVVKPADNIPSERKDVKKEAVASYRVKTDNPLNDWYFSVELFETSKTFQYVMKLAFEEITGKDTLRLPNFGIMPEPVIRKGPEQYSAIIGFLDKEKQFREYKKVYVVGEEKLKVTALKHYGVSTYQQ